MPRKAKEMTLDDARKRRKLQRFAKEHPAEGDMEQFDCLFRAMAGEKPSSKPGTSNGETSED